MTPKKGHGGSMTINGNALPTINAEIPESNRVAETTNSGTGGRATWLGTVSEADFSCSVVYDDDALLQAAGVEVGASVPVVGKLGDSSKNYSGTAVIATVKHRWNNREGVVEADVTGKFSGALTRPS